MSALTTYRSVVRSAHPSTLKPSLSQSNSTFSSAVGQYHGLIQPFQQCRQTIVSSGSSPQDLQSAVEATAQLKIKITAVINQYGGDCGCKSHAASQDLVCPHLTLWVTTLHSSHLTLPSASGCLPPIVDPNLCRAPIDGH